MMKYIHRAAPYIRCVVFLAVVAAVIALCDFLFAPSGYIRFILYELNSGETHYDTIVLGASHARSAIDPEMLDEQLGTTTLNLAIPGETIEDSYYLAKESCEENDIKTIILDVDYQYWYATQLEHEFITPFIFNKMSWRSRQKYEYLLDNRDWLDFRQVFTNRASYTFSKDAITENIRIKRTDAYRNYAIDGAQVKDANGPYMGQGFFYREISGLPPGGFDYMNLWIGRENGDFEGWVLNYFSQIKNYCDANGIELICVTSPITPTAVKHLGMYKIDCKFQEYFKKMNVPFYNFNLTRMDVLPRDDVDYGDMEGHMGGELAQKYSKLLGKFLKERRTGTLDTKKYFYDTFGELYKNTYRIRHQKVRE